MSFSDDGALRTRNCGVNVVRGRDGRGRNSPTHGDYQLPRPFLKHNDPAISDEAEA